MALLPLIAIAAGLAVLVWSAGRFVAGAASLATHFGMPPLLVGMVVVGFGTSAPEMLVSAIGSLQGNPGIALGNAYGSNIANTGLILGFTALLSPIAVQSAVLRRELPMLVAACGLAILLLLDGALDRIDAWVLLGVFAVLLVWSILQARANAADPYAREAASEEQHAHLAPGPAVLWTVAGLLLLIASSRLVVWGAVETAQALGVSDLVIGLTILAIGTSLPELAAALAAIRHKAHDIALGNVIGSNLFNTLAVVGIAGLVREAPVPQEVIWRDLPVMTGFALVLFFFGYGFRGPGTGRINRLEGALLLAAFLAYTAWLVRPALAGGAV